MTDEKELSGPRASILHTLGDHIQRQGRPPTYREIGEALGMALAVVSYHVGVLEELGYVKRRAGVARGLQLTGRAETFLGLVSSNLLRIGIQGTIAAGEPIDVDPAVQPDPGDSAAWIAVDPARLPRRRDNLFALEVRGQSMIDALVDDRDIVILQRTVEPREIRNGDMVAAWLKLEQETTLKYFHRDGTQVRLEPANPHFEPIEAHAGNVEVKGKVVLVIRQPGK
jgi:repressor LexA